MFPASGAPLDVIAWYVQNRNCELAEPKFGFVIEKGSFVDLRARTIEFRSCADDVAAEGNFHTARTLAGWCAAFGVAAILIAADRREFDIDELKGLPTLPRGALSKPELGKLVAAYLFVATSADRARDAVDEQLIPADMPPDEQDRWRQFQRDHWRTVKRQLASVLQVLARAGPRGSGGT